MTEVERIKIRLRELEVAIFETEKRIPAHSVKPPVMEDLFRLEDEKETLLNTLKGFE
jgi:hypothetical protein